LWAICPSILDPSSGCAAVRAARGSGMIAFTLAVMSIVPFWFAQLRLMTIPLAFSSAVCGLVAILAAASADVGISLVGQGFVFFCLGFVASLLALVIARLGKSLDPAPELATGRWLEPEDASQHPSFAFYCELAAFAFFAVGSWHPAWWSMRDASEISLWESCKVGAGIGSLADQVACNRVHALRALLVIAAVLAFATTVALETSFRRTKPAMTMGMAFLTAVLGVTAAGVAESIEVVGGKLDGGFLFLCIGLFVSVLGMVSVIYRGKASTDEDAATESTAERSPPSSSQPGDTEANLQDGEQEVEVTI